MKIDGKSIFFCQQVGKKNVNTALSLIGYEKDLKAAMEFVFGSVFVCSDMNSAKKVTFDEKVMKKSVTMDGDSFDPAGTLTGGTCSSMSNLRETSLCDSAEYNIISIVYLSFI